LFSTRSLTAHLVAVHEDDPAGEVLPAAQLWHVEPTDGAKELAGHSLHSPSHESLDDWNCSGLAESSYPALRSHGLPVA
jgi:hypothetical protein